MNGFGNVYGGCFMVFVDYCLFVIVIYELEGLVVIINFVCDFFDVVCEGELVECIGEVLWVGGLLIFLCGKLIFAGWFLFMFLGMIKWVKWKLVLLLNV